MEDLKELFEKLNKVDIMAIRRENREFSFMDMYPKMAENYEFYKKLEESSRFWEQTPKPNKDYIKDHFNEFVNTIEQIQNFNPQQVSNPTPEWNRLRKAVEDSYANSFNFRRDLRIYLVENEINDLKTNISDYQKDMIKEAENTLKLIKERSKQSDDIVKSMMEASAVTGLTKFAGVFEEQAKSNKKASIWWLIISGIFAIGLGVVLWWIFEGINSLINPNVQGITPMPLSTTASIQVMIAKVLLLSFASVVFYQVVKNYNAHMHQYTLNKHRENCLKTFKSLVESTQDGKTRDAVLIQATKAIFESGDTGYVTGKEGPNSMFEVTKLIDKGQ